MYGTEPITLSRDCEAVTIPAGEKVTLLKDEKAYITQSLGGNHTVVVNGNMFQIDGKNADAIGMEVVDNTPKRNSGEPVTRESLEKQVWEQMKTCYDPEIPVNVVDLGLIYNCELDQIPGQDEYKVDVKMTLTAPGCGMGDFIRQDVHNKIMMLEGIDEAVVDLVWEPQWNRDMMSEAAKLQLGML